MNKGLLSTIAIAALASATAAHATTIGSFSEVASTGTAAVAGTTGAFGGALGPGGAVGGMIGGPVSFTAPSTGLLEMTVTDCCVVGDVYQAFLNGTSVGVTSAVPLDGPTLSSGVFTMSVTSGQSLTFDVSDILQQYIGVADPYGGGIVPSSISPAGFSVMLQETTSVPEPGTLGLLAAGMVGIGFWFRRRRIKS